MATSIKENNLPKHQGQMYGNRAKYIGKTESPVAEVCLSAGKIIVFVETLVL